ncbi:S41 family peptidase [Nesterenkonia aurantiaca]|uniref:S41 family peptidase n=1 Tax=Nesterenkonia aurantiaca TaxID=1436010 RepID=UPI003EE659B5
MVLPVFSRPVRTEFVGVDGAEAILPLLELEHREFEAVLGQPLQLGRPSAADEHVWQVQITPDAPEVQLRSDPVRRSLTSVVPGGEYVGETLNLLHALAHSDQQVVSSKELKSYQQVVARIHTMIANVYPYFDLRDMDWEQICARYPDLAELPSDQFWTQAQRWVAELGDAHTAIISPGPIYNPPYVAEMTDRGARLHQVPDSSSAHRAGVRPGWVLLVEDPRHWLGTTGASPQHQKLVAARRSMQFRTSSRRFTASSPEGHHVSWEETPQLPGPSVAATGSSIRISRFDTDTLSLLAQVLRDREGDSAITIDLRANVGGSVVAADQCRRMLIRRPGDYGYMQYSDGRGGLSSLYPLWLEPIRAGFTGDTQILVDSMTYSAAEDFLQPLVGLDHVSVQGGPTGGGSGRPTTVPLMDGYSLRVSTAITYTGVGDPVEHFGIDGTF